MAHGDITHIDIPVSDMGRATSFYGQLFGWQIAEVEGYEGYPMWQAPNKISGGGLAPRSEGFTQPRSYVEVDSIEETLRAHLKEQLPSYMVPAAYVTLPVLPLREVVLFPGVTAPIGAGRPATLRATEDRLHELTAGQVDMGLVTEFLQVGPVATKWTSLRPPCRSWQATQAGAPRLPRQTLK